MSNGTFTKVYNIEPNNEQRQAITRAFKMLVTAYCLQGDNVTVTVSEGTSLFNNDSGLLVTLSVENKPALTESRYVGSKGGLRVI